MVPNDTLHLSHKQRLGGRIAKPVQRLEALGHGREGTRKERSNVAVPGRNVQGGGKVGAIIWKQEMGGDQVDDQSPDGVPSLVGEMDHGDDDKTRDRQRVGVTRGRWGDGQCWDTPNMSVHQEVADKYIGEVGMPPCLWTVNRGGADAGDETYSALVGSRCGKWIGGIDGEEL